MAENDLLRDSTGNSCVIHYLLRPTYIIFLDNKLLISTYVAGAYHKFIIYNKQLVQVNIL